MSLSDQEKDELISKLREDCRYFRDKAFTYEREYILPAFDWAEEMGIDLRDLIGKSPGKNCVEVFFQVLRDRLRLAEKQLKDLDTLY